MLDLSAAWARFQITTTQRAFIVVLGTVYYTQVAYTADFPLQYGK